VPRREGFGPLDGKSGTPVQRTDTNRFQRSGPLDQGWAAKIGCLGGFNDSGKPEAAPLAPAVARTWEMKQARDLGGLGLSRQVRAVEENPTNTMVELRLQERDEGWADNRGGSGRVGGCSSE
jgi:hypothetical protein